MFKVSKVVEEILSHVEEDLQLFIFLCRPTSPSVLQLLRGSRHLFLAKLIYKISLLISRINLLVGQEFISFMV